MTKRQKITILQIEKVLSAMVSSFRLDQYCLLYTSAVGVAEKVCVFLMLVASAYMQSISAFVAQNNGAGKFERSRRALFYGIKTALLAGLVMGLSLIHIWRTGLWKG